MKNKNENLNPMNDEKPTKMTEKRGIDILTMDVKDLWGKTFVFIQKTRIKTWQGVFILAFVAGAAAAVIWTVSVNIQTSSKAAGETSSLYLYAESGSVGVGETFPVDITMDSNNSGVVAVKAIVNYNKDDFELVSWDTANNSAFADDQNYCNTSGHACEIVDNDSANGKITITVAKPAPGISSDTGITIAELVFHSLRPVAPTAPNFTLSYTAGSYNDADVILDDGLGTDILNQVTGTTITAAAPTCTDFTYTDYGTCLYDADLGGYYEHRTLTSQSPVGCEGGDPDLDRACAAPACTDWTYGAWTPATCPAEGRQTRTASDPLPIACTGGTPIIEQNCTYNPDAPPTCNFDVGPWDPEVCPADGHQTRTVTASPTGCEGGIRPAEQQDCTYVPPTCTYSYGPWSPVTCPDGGGTQSREESKSSPDCQGGDRLPTTQTCTSNTCSTFTYDSWTPATCPASGLQTRTYSASPASCTGGNPVIQQSCTYVVPVTPTPNKKDKDDHDDKKDDKKKSSDKTKPTLDIPLALNKYRGARIWWTGKDNKGVDYYTYTFAGKKGKTKAASFNVPANTPRGIHILTLRAYDKAGNMARKYVVVRVR